MANKKKLVRKENNSFEQATSAIENTCQDTSQHQQPSSGLDKYVDGSANQKVCHYIKTR